jgi:homoserine kinase type II
MAVYTDITEGELGAFLEGYVVGDLLSYKGIAEGSENSNFLLHTSSGAYILTLYEKRVDSADLPFFLGLMEHLAKKGISCPLPVHRRDGQVIGQLAGRPAAVITFLEGMWMRRPTVAHCREVGKAMAGLHLAGADFPLSRENALGIEGWRKLWDGARARADEVEPGLAAEVDRDFDDLGQNWPKTLPAGIIHADLFPDNVFFLGDRLSGLIDFYFACNDLYAYDIATGLNAWCFEKDHAFNLTKGTALLSGYQSVRPLSAAEKQALPVLARGSALRFMLTRLYDWLTISNGTLVQKRDPTEYIRKLRFHRQIGSASEYGVQP